MFLHARKGHVEPLGKGCDRSVRTPELLQNAASGGVRERAERGIEVGLAILSHTVQYNSMGDGMQCEAEPVALAPRAKDGPMASSQLVSADDEHRSLDVCRPADFV